MEKPKFTMAKAREQPERYSASLSITHGNIQYQRGVPLASSP